MVEKDSSSFDRAVRMGKLSVGIASSYLGYQIQNLYLEPEASKRKRQSVHKRASSKIREELHQLRGPIMKLGQALSMQDHALPQEFIDEFTSLQMEAPPMHGTLMRIQFRKALGKNPEEVFETFDPKPFAAASLGQVHQATTQSGDKVAVKIQYPAIREVIENDFKILRTCSLPAKMAGYMPKAALDEFERGILKETDYLNEAANIQLFRKGLEDVPYAQVPEVYPSHSTDTVLTMSHLKGKHLAEFLRKKRSQVLRDQIGTRLIELFCLQLHSVHALHADPHPGNYLFTADGGINLLDFGCFKKLNANTVELIGLFARRAYHDKSHFDEIVHRTFGKITKAKPSHARRVIKQFIKFFETVYPENHTAEDTIDFGKPKTLELLQEVWRDALRSKLIDPEFLFTNRAEMGIYNILHTLKARVATTHTLNRVLDHLS